MLEWFLVRYVKEIIYQLMSYIRFLILFLSNILLFTLNIF